MKILECAFVLGNIPALPDTENRARAELGKDVCNYFLLEFSWSIFKTYDFFFFSVDEGLHVFIPVVCELG